MKSQTKKLMGGIPEDEFKYHLNLFKESEDFALIKISGGCIENSLEKIIADLKVLQENNLNPIVVYGWGSQLDEKLKKKNIPIEKINGNRVTYSETMDEILDIIDKIKYQTKELSKKYDLEVVDLTDQKLIDANKLHLGMAWTGKVVDVDSEAIKEVYKNKKIPFIAPLGYSESKGHYYNINADDVAKEIFKKIKPKKYIALTECGGIFDKNKKLIKKINLNQDFEKLKKGNFIYGGMLKKLEESNDLLKGSNNEYSVQITSPDNLLTELFTYDGLGTKITEFEEKK